MRLRLHHLKHPASASSKVISDILNSHSADIYNTSADAEKQKKSPATIRYIFMFSQIKLIKNALDQLHNPQTHLQTIVNLTIYFEKQHL